jgi:hypothetical protein
VEAIHAQACKVLKQETKAFESKETQQRKAKEETLQKGYQAHR